MWVLLHIGRYNIREERLKSFNLPVHKNTTIFVPANNMLLYPEGNRAGQDLANRIEMSQFGRLSHMH
jgi:hypothetical protein